MQCLGREPAAGWISIANQTEDRSIPLYYLYALDLTGKPMIVIAQPRDTDQQKHTCTTSIRYYSRNQRHKAQIKPSARNPLIMFNNSPNI
ncbi:hypothetical protein KQX54_021583 [Cotesia glomerata]|uniref:Uncharacterized protein n=1 Tax=Cotesia glomerata TaxID=32391 RepID=A0AAV7JAA3_COTGL|nr:hypothetical protein KQX54_021583 [Cotesia glomerata]